MKKTSFAKISKKKFRVLNIKVQFIQGIYELKSVDYRIYVNNSGFLILLRILNLYLRQAFL